MRSILDELKLHTFLNFVEDKQVDICCITETWFQSMSGKHTKDIKDAGFKIIHSVRENKGGGGTAILYKKVFKICNGESSVSKYSSFEYSYICMRHLKQKLIILTVYRLGEVSCSVFCCEFEEFLQNLSDKCDILCAVGDFNVWAEKPRDTDAKSIKRIMKNFGLSQLVNVPTHDAGHTLDLIFLNKFQLSTEWAVEDDLLDVRSDHFPVFFTIPWPRQPVMKKYISSQKLHNVDLNLLKQELIPSLNPLFDNQHWLNFAEMLQFFNTTSSTLVNYHAPVTTKYINSNMQAPWIDTEYKTSRSKRRQLERSWKRSLSLESRQSYIDQRKKCAEMAVTKKKLFYENLLNKVGTDQKKLYGIINSLLDCGKKTRHLPSDPDSKKLSNDFNNYFITKISTLRQLIPITCDTLYLTPFIGSRLTIFTDISDEDIINIISQCGIKTSPLDPIPAPLLRKLVPDLIPYFRILVNRSLQEGSLDGLKTSIVEPLLKNIKLDKEVKKHFRPVANLTFLSKLAERHVQRQLNHHMTENALHDKSQFAYKKYHSTETMLLGLTDEILTGFDDDKCTIIIFLDLSAAFDTIDINLLTDILRVEIGIDGLAIEWLKSFLLNRVQRVKINDSLSDPLDILYGVPQGSVLGPFLFSVYTRSQSKIFANCNLKSSSFADDVNGRKTFSLSFQFECLTHAIVHSLSEITKWMNQHFLSINTAKTDILLFRPTEKDNKVLINGVILDNDICLRFTDKVKNLGVLLDKNLKFNKHVTQTTSHCHKLIKDLWRIRSVLSKDHIENLVHSLISMKIDYCNSLLYNITKITLIKLQKVQNAAARLVCRARKRTSTTLLLKNLHWLPVESRILFKIILITHKCIWGRCSDNLTILLTYKNFNRSDQDLLLDTPPARTKYGKRSFRFIAPRLWNALPNTLRNNDDTEIFKRQLKTLLFTDTELLKNRALCYN